MPARDDGLTLLVDTSSILYRAYYAVPDTLRAPDGMPVNAAYGFCNMLARLVADLRPASVACALDDDWRPAWRVELIDSYKAHRVADADDEVDDTIDVQADLVVQVLEMAGVATVGCEGYEAEDVIGALLPRAPGPVAIVSGDRDLFQLVRDPDVRVLYPKRGVTDLVTIDEAEIERRYGIPGRAYADFAILRGDPSDGLPGVKGIGEKTATALIAGYGTLEAVIDAARDATSGPLAKVAAATDYLRRAARVVRITHEAPVGDVPIALPLRDPDPKLSGFAEQVGLAGPVSRLLAAIRDR